MIKILFKDVKIGQKIQFDWSKYTLDNVLLEESPIYTRVEETEPSQTLTYKENGKIKKAWCSPGNDIEVFLVGD